MHAAAAAAAGARSPCIILRDMSSPLALPNQFHGEHQSDDPAVATAAHWRVAPGLREEEQRMQDLPLHDAELTSELRCPPCGAWDFPMSREEKIRRLILVFEAEAKTGDHEILALQREKDIWRARALAAESTPATATEVGRCRADALDRASRAAAGAQAVLCGDRLSHVELPQVPLGPPPSRPAGIPGSPKKYMQQPRASLGSSDSAGASPRNLTPRPNAGLRTRRRTTVFTTRDTHEVVRIPRRTAPPMAFAPPLAVPEQACTRLSTAHRHSIAQAARRNSTGGRRQSVVIHSECWDSFGDGSEEEMMTPESGAASPPSLSLSALPEAPGPLTTPDGIQIVVKRSNSADGEWRCLTEDRWAMFSDGESDFGSDSSHGHFNAPIEFGNTCPKT